MMDIMWLNILDRQTKTSSEGEQAEQTETSSEGANRVMDKKN
jgi:hypothetical protein